MRQTLLYTTMLSIALLAPSLSAAADNSGNGTEAKAGERVTEETQVHQDVLSDAWERTPREARFGISTAMDHSMTGFGHATARGSGNASSSYGGGRGSFSAGMRGNAGMNAGMAGARGSVGLSANARARVGGR